MTKKNAHVVTIANQKGGVAKTTTAYTLASLLQKKGYKVLAIDMDPQANLSSCAEGADYVDHSTIMDVMKRDCRAEDAIQNLECFDLIASNIMLSSAEQEISSIGKEQRLNESIQNIKHKYDYIVIDTPPTLGLLTINAFTASDDIVITTSANIFAVRGINQLYEHIQSVKKYVNPELRVRGILITMFDERTNNDREIKQVICSLAEALQITVYDTVISNSVVVREAQARKTSISDYRKDNKVANDYEKFVEEFLAQ